MTFVVRSQANYKVTDFRANFMREKIIISLRAILVHLYYPIEIREQIRKKDIFGVDSMAYMEQMNSYTCMDTKIMDHIMKEYWNSNIDMSGGDFFACSTCYNILTKYEFKVMKDYETNHRFYSPREEVS